MRRTNSKKGMTLVEVMVAVFLVGAAAAIVYTEMILSYRILMRSRARLEAQGLAFDGLWKIYNAPLDNMPVVSTTAWVESTPAESILSSNGIIECLILAETNPPVLPDRVWYWDIVVQVWPEEGSPLQVGTNPLARYAVRRYRGER